MPDWRAAIALTALSFFLGCGDAGKTMAEKTGTTPGPPKSADPDDVPISEKDVARPKNYQEAIARIKSYRDTIQQETTTGKPSRAHRALDELAFVLEWLPDIAEKSGASVGQLKEVIAITQRMDKLFGEVHGRIDHKRPPDYAAVAQDIDKAIKQLEAIPIEKNKRELPSR